jgi:hypothetical protein
MKRKSITIALCLVATLLFTLQLCNPTDSFHDVKGEQYWREQNEKEIMQLNRVYQRNLSDLQAKSDSLKKELKQTAEKLKASKLKQHLSEHKVLTLAQPDTVSSVKDQLSTCDSLRAEVINYVSHVDSTQAYYDTTIVQMQEIITVKDSGLRICETSYEKLKEISEDNLRREQRVTDELNKAVKQNKRKTIQNKILAGGILLLSGFAATILLKGK